MCKNLEEAAKKFPNSPAFKKNVQSGEITRALPPEGFALSEEDMTVVPGKDEMSLG